MQRLNDVFEITSTLFENSFTIIYRALRLEDGRKVILKTHKRPEDIHKTRHEYELLRGRSIMGIANVLDIFDNKEDPVFLVSEDHDAMVLEDYLSLELYRREDFLTLALNAANALDQVHHSGIIHRDIKPANMLVNPKNLDIWYIDFGISLEVRPGTELWQESVAGTLEYLSPEQTGRVSRPLDSRTDIYSLGVVFYRMITGRLPFVESSAMAIIHAHIAGTPVPPIELADMSPIVSRGVLKMLEKRPENRYQTAFSLAYDIERCRALLSTDQDPNDFMLGERDILYDLEPGHKLFGKAEPLRALGEAFDRMDADAAQLVLLDGSPAVGKSTVLTEFQRQAVRRGALLLRTECDVLTADEPYCALRALFEQFEPLIYSARVSLSAYRDQIAQRLGENTGALLEILPQLQSFLGPQAPAPQLPLRESQTRAEQVFRVFMQIVCGIPYPAVFILDNAHWADEASLRLIFAALGGTGLGNSMMIFSYNSEAPGAAQRLHRYVDRLSMASIRLTPVSVMPLSAPDVARIIGDIFPMDSQDITVLAELAHRHSEGNVRRLHIYLKDLYHAGAISFDGSPGRWVWHREAVSLEGLQDLAGRVAQAYARLPEEAVRCVKLLSCVGPSLERELVEIILGEEMPLDAVKRALAPVLSLGYMAWDESGRHLAFESSRVCLLVYGSMDDQARRAGHYRIGLRLYHHFADNPVKLAEHCALITGQLERYGFDHIGQDNRDNLRRMNFMAGDAARTAASYEKAVGYYQTGLALATAGQTPETDPDIHEITLRYAGCRFALGDREEARALYERLIDSAGDEERRHRVFDDLVGQHVAVADWLSAQQYIERYLEGTGLLIRPDGPRREQAATQHARYEANVLQRELDSFLTAEMSTDPQVCRRGGMLALMAECALMNMDGDTRYYIFRAANYAYENGLFPHFEHVLASLAERRANQRDFARAKQIFLWGIQYAERHGRPQGCLWAVYCSVIAHWVEPLGDIPAIYQKAKHVALMEGNLYYGAFADLMLISHSLYTGVSLSQVHRDIDAALHNAERAGFDLFSLVFGTSFRQYVRCMTGRTKGLDSFDDRMFSEEATIAGTPAAHWRFNAQFYYVYRMQALYINGYYSQVLAYADRLADTIPGDDRASAFLVRVQYYYYHSLAMLRLCEKDRSLQEKYIPVIVDNQRRLKVYVDAMPQSFEMKHRLVEIELSRLQGFGLSFISLYSKVDLEFERAGCTWDRAMIEEALIRQWEGRGIIQYRDLHSRVALDFYRKVGARVKVLQLMGSAPGATGAPADTGTFSASLTLPSSAASPLHSATGLSLTGDTLSGQALDYQAILNVISCLVSETDTQSLFDQLLSLMMKNAGAEQALLFLADGDKLELRGFRYTGQMTRGLLHQDLPMALEHIDPAIVPKKVVALSLQKGARLVANTSDSEFIFLGDPYLEQHRPESFICLPIVARQAVIGIIYLENARLPDIFPPGRVDFLEAIVLQASLLIQNALDLNALEGYTADLEGRLSSYIGQLNTLIAGIAHEINSPLGVCVTVATRLEGRAREIQSLYQARQLSKGALEEFMAEAMEGLKILVGNITRAGELVQNFKRISVDQAGEAFEVLPLRETLTHIIDYIRPATKRVIGHIDLLCPEALTLYTAPGALAQVFTNLIMNSATHAFAGRRGKNLVTIDVEETGDSVSIVYSDNGRGMSPQEREQVFMPFFTTRRKEGGSGLGGHIILSLVTQTLAGSVHCTSTPGQGTSFIIRLPKNLEQLQQSKRAAKEDNGHA